MCRVAGSGAGWIPAVGIIANSVETVAVWQAETLAEQPQLLVALWGISGALWNSVLTPWATLILGFSVAGRLSGAVPLMGRHHGCRDDTDIPIVDERSIRLS